MKTKKKTTKRRIGVGVGDQMVSVGRSNTKKRKGIIAFGQGRGKQWPENG